MDTAAAAANLSLLDLLGSDSLREYWAGILYSPAAWAVLNEVDLLSEEVQAVVKRAPEELTCKQRALRTWLQERALQFGKDIAGWGGAAAVWAGAAELGACDALNLMMAILSAPTVKEIVLLAAATAASAVQQADAGVAVALGTAAPKPPQPSAGGQIIELSRRECRREHVTRCARCARRLAWQRRAEKAK